MVLPVDIATLMYADSLLARVGRERLAKTERELVAGRPFDVAIEMSGTFHDPRLLGARVASAWRNAEVDLAASVATSASRDAAICVTRACIGECRRHFERLKSPRPHLSAWITAVETAFAFASQPARSDTVDDRLAAYRTLDGARVPYESQKLWSRAMARAKRKHGEKDWYSNIDRGDLIQRALADIYPVIIDLESMRNSVDIFTVADRGERVWPWKNAEYEATGVEFERRNFDRRLRMLGYYVRECVNALTMHLGSKTRLQKALRACIKPTQIRDAVVEAARAAET